MITEKTGMGIRAGLVAVSLTILPGGAGLSLAAAPAAADAPSERVTSLINRMRGVLGDVTTLRYDGDVRVQMPDGRRIAVSETKVVAERLEAGGWKILVDGTFGFEWVDPKAPRKDNPVTVRAAWDGLILSALIEKRKVLRKTAPSDMDLVRLDMNQADAAATVAWDLLANPPFGNMDDAQKIELEEPAKVGDFECDVLWVVPAGGKNPPVPFKLFLAQKDGLPRRMEVFRPATVRLPKDKRGEAGIVMTYSNVIGTPEASGVSFDIELPAGYTLSAARNLPKEDSRPQTKKPAVNPGPAPAPVADAPPKFPLAPSDDELLRPGSTPPAFKLKDFDGKERTLEEFKGKVVVLDFWGTWCPPCRMAMPTVQKIHEKFADKGVVVLGMNFESNPNADPVKFKKEKGYTYQSLAGAQQVSGSFRVSGWPTFYVIGKDGKIVWGSRGLATPPGGTNDQEVVLDYLEGNLTQAVEKALK